MKSGFGIFEIILLLGTIQGFILALSLLGRKKENKVANRFLALFLLLISLTMLGRLLLETSVIKSFPNFLALPDAIIFLYGPLMYLHLRKLLVDTPIKKAKVFAYFLPAILFLLSEIPLLLGDDHYLKVLWVKHTTLRFVIIEGVAILHNIYFFVLQCRLFIRYKNASNNNFSYKQYPSHWLLYLLIAITLVVWMFSYFSWVFGYYNLLSVVGYRIIWMTLPFITYAMGYFAMRNPDFFKINLQNNNYKNPIPDKEKDRLLKQVLTTMEHEKLYKNPEFSLTFFADKLSVDRNKLSQLINDEFKKNFNDWTNDYRIADSKSFLLESSNLSIKEIYYDVGFNSKSAFNSAFKKRAGMTPSEFRQKLKK